VSSRPFFALLSDFDAGDGQVLGNVLSRTLTCLARCSSDTWAYPLVIRRLLCPSSLCMLTRSTPAMAKRLPNEWRKSCHLKPLISATCGAVLNDFFKLRIASPAWVPAAWGKKYSELGNFSARLLRTSHTLSVMRTNRVSLFFASVLRVILVWKFHSSFLSKSTFARRTPVFSATSIASERCSDPSAAANLGKQQACREGQRITPP